MPLPFISLGITVLTAGFVCAAEPGLVERLSPVAPCAALVAAAQAHRIPLERIDPPGEAGRLEPGHSVTALVTLFERDAQRTQWLLHLEASSGSRPTNPPSRMTMYASTGGKLEFVSAPSLVTLWTLGPFDASEAKRQSLESAITTARFELDRDFLGLGLHHAAVALLRLRETNVRGSFTFSRKPFSGSQISQNRKAVAPVRLSPEEERALAGTVPALLSYLTIIQQTKGLSDILFELVDKPSAWSLVRRGGVHTSFRYVNENLGRADASVWQLPASIPVYRVPMVIELNKKPALNITFVATNPRPPLLACGGVVGMLAEKPGDKHTWLTLRVISARRSSPSILPK